MSFIGTNFFFSALSFRVNSNNELHLHPGHTVDSVMKHIIEKQKLRWDELRYIHSTKPTKPLTHKTIDYLLFIKTIYLLF